MKKSLSARDEPGSGEVGDPGRRSFLTRAWLLLGAVASVEIVWLLTNFLRPRNPRADSLDQSELLVAGPIDRFPPNSVTAFPEGRFYLARIESGGFLAINRKCTHLGCTVPWIASEGKFVCPCHASAFDITGEVINPPAPRALDLHPVRIENGIVKVDLRKSLQRSAFEADQVTMA